MKIYVKYFDEAKQIASKTFDKLGGDADATQGQLRKRVGQILNVNYVTGIVSSILSHEAGCEGNLEDGLCSCNPTLFCTQSQEDAELFFDRISKGTDTPMSEKIDAPEEKIPVEIPVEIPVVEDELEDEDDLELPDEDEEDE